MHTYLFVESNEETDELAKEGTSLRGGVMVGLHKERCSRSLSNAVFLYVGVGDCDDRDESVPNTHKHE